MKAFGFALALVVGSSSAAHPQATSKAEVTLYGGARLDHWTDPVAGTGLVFKISRLLSAYPFVTVTQLDAGGAVWHYALASQVNLPRARLLRALLGTYAGVGV